MKLYSKIKYYSNKMFDSFKLALKIYTAYTLQNV